MPLDRALTRFARAYADQTEADHALLVAAVRRGVFPTTETGEGAFGLSPLIPTPPAHALVARCGS